MLQSAELFFRNLYLLYFLHSTVSSRQATNRSRAKFCFIGLYQFDLLSQYVIYRERLEHQNVTFNENGTVTAIPKHPLEWVPELSPGRKEDDLLTLPNIALLVSFISNTIQTIVNISNLTFNLKLS